MAHIAFLSEKLRQMTASAFNTPGTTAATAPALALSDLRAATGDPQSAGRVRPSSPFKMQESKSAPATAGLNPECPYCCVPSIWAHADTALRTYIRSTTGAAEFCGAARDIVD